MYPANALHAQLGTLTEQVREITRRMNEQVLKNQIMLGGKLATHPGTEPRVSSRFRRMSSSSSSSADSGEIMG